MENIIHWMSANRELCRVLWGLCGLIGYLILRKTRSEFYKNRKAGWWIMVCLMYYLTGPTILLFGITTLIVDFFAYRKIEKQLK